MEFHAPGQDEYDVRNARARGENFDDTSSPGRARAIQPPSLPRARGRLPRKRSRRTTGLRGRRRNHQRFRADRRQHVDFAAQGGPTTFTNPPIIGGPPVTGHFRAGGEFDPAGVTEFQQEGPVTCLVVDGNRARLVYPLKQATPETNEALEVLIFLEDKGRPADGDPRDEIGFVLLPDEDPLDDPPSERDSECVFPPKVPSEFTPLQKGNFTIHDSP